MLRDGSNCENGDGKHSFLLCILESGIYKDIECSYGKDSRNVLQFPVFKWSNQVVESLLRLKCESG